MAKGIVVVEIDAIVSRRVMCGSKIRQYEKEGRVIVTTNTELLEKPPNLSATKPINRWGLIVSRSKARS